MKNKHNIHNFGATSELANQILTRVVSKLNPSPNKGAVSNHARQILGTFSTWETSKGVSDELKKFMGPLEVNHQSTCPDASGLELTRMNNAIFDEAMKNVIMEMYQESNQTNFAENSGDEDFLKKIFIKDGKVNPISTGLVSAGAAALYTSLTRKKKKDEKEEKEDNMLDLAKSAALGYIAGHGGAVVYNGAGESVEENKPKLGEKKTEEETKPETESKTESNEEKKEDVVKSVKAEEHKVKEAAKSKTKTTYGLSLTDKNDRSTINISYKTLKKFNPEIAASIRERIKALDPEMPEWEKDEIVVRVPSIYLPENRAFRSFVPDDKNLYVRRLVDNDFYQFNEDTMNELVKLAREEDPAKLIGILNEYDSASHFNTESDIDDRLRKYLARQHALQLDHSTIDPDADIYLYGKDRNPLVPGRTRELSTKRQLDDLAHKIKEHLKSKNNKK